MSPIRSTPRWESSGADTDLPNLRGVVLTAGLGGSPDAVRAF
jgi:hypothetical protein